MDTKISSRPCQMPSSTISGFHYKSFMIVINNCNDSTIIIYDCNDSGLYYTTTVIAR
jgi:hypothetical protein